MKKHLFAWLMLFFLSIGHMMGQANINIVNNNISIRAALYQIEKQSGYSLAFDEGALDVDKEISLSIKGESLDQALKNTLKGTNCTFAIKKNHIIISRQVETTKLVPQETKKVSGTIVDKDGLALIGVTVAIKGSSIGTVTDLDGKFSLEKVDAKTVLNISYVGYNAQNMTVGSNNKFDIVLTEDTRMLDEIVVVGYNTVRKKDLTTSVAVISTKDLNERPITQVAQALQGKAAGVQVVQPSGAPGGTLSIRVRGSSSFEAGNEPLYVVDGIPMTNISNLSPGDIETMQVLKDASSAAIYGARAANGVVLITTKRGKDGARSVSFSAYKGFSKLGRKIGALNTEEYKDLMVDLKKQIPTTILIPDDETRYRNWTDDFYGTGVNDSYQLSLSNGTDKYQYFVSAGVMNEEGIIKKANFDRYNFRANIDNQQTDWLKMGLNLGYTQTKGRSVGGNKTAMRGGSILSVINTPPYMDIWDADNPGVYDEFAYGSRIYTPFAANAANDTYKTTRLVASLNLDFTILKDLHYKVHLGIDEDNSRNESYLAPGITSDSRSYNGIYSVGSTKSFEWLLENIVTYDKQIKKHKVSLLGGATIQRSTSEGSGGGGYDLLGPSLNLANIINPDESWSEYYQSSLASFLGRVSYDYDSKYLFSGNIRADGSSKFYPGKQWGIFPSASAAWRVSAEPFMEKTKDVVSDLKFRFGWGLNGNQEGIGSHDWMAAYHINRNAPTEANKLPGMSVSPAGTGYVGLRWETTNQYNAGIDASLFDSRLEVTLDLYYKYTKDLIKTFYPPSASQSTGSVLSNMGEMSNKGLEIGISSRNIDSPKFKWSTDFNISFNKNRAEQIGITPVEFYATLYTNEQPAIILKNGYKLGTFYGYKTDGINPETGDVIYRDLDGNNIITPDDRTVIGDAQPMFIGGLTNTFSYANFNLSIFFQGSYGNDIYNASKIDMTGMLDFRNQSKDVLRRWKRPGMITDIPRAGNIENVRNSDRFVEDGSYLRFKSLTLSYDFNVSKGIFNKIGLRKLQPYFTAQNLWTWTNYTGYDPEVNAYERSSLELGVDYGTYPQSKTFIFGVNVEF